MDSFEFKALICPDGGLPIGYETKSGLRVFYGRRWRFWNWLGLFRAIEPGITI